MKELDAIVFDKVKYERELDKLEQMLNAYPSLSESKHILPFFRQNKQISNKVASFLPMFHQIDQIGFEYDIFGDYKCDLIVGNSQKHTYCFIEFEDASENSVFIKKNTKYQPEFAPRFEHGYSQIVDWFYRLRYASPQQLEERFGSHHIDYSGLLIIGRDAYLSKAEKRRLDWRHQNLIVDSKRIHIITFDELLASLKAQPPRF